MPTMKGGVQSACRNNAEKMFQSVGTKRYLLTANWGIRGMLENKKSFRAAISDTAKGHHFLTIEAKLRCSPQKRD